MQQFNFFCSDFRNQDYDHRVFFLEKPWKLKKNMLESFLHQGKKATLIFFVLIIHFSQFRAEKTFNFFSKIVQNHLKREKN